MTISAKQQLTFTNSLDDNLDSIYLHIYPNTFRNRGTAPFEERELTSVYPNGFSPGWMEIHNVKVKGDVCHYKIIGTNKTILRITLNKPLNIGDTADISIEFTVKLPNANTRLGYGEETVNISNWYPILSVYDTTGWNLDPYYSIGDPFYSEMAIYKVSLAIPKDFSIAATGNIIKMDVDKDNATYWIEADIVRDFAMVLSKGFDIKEGVINDITVNSFTLGDEKKEEALQYGIDSIEIFNKLFGHYPYKQISIVACDFFLGGMEYPNLVMISKNLYEIEEDFPLEYVIAHEIAHQWWYGIVGNNEIIEPWLDEALTEYSTLMYFEEKYGDHIKEQIFEKMIKAQYENFTSIEPDKGEGILRSLREFESNLEYSSIVYSKGAMFLEELRNNMGDEAFLEGIRQYFNQYKYKNATTLDFYELMEANSEKELKPLFEEWLNIKVE
ncbi:M1 family metallopeptidase [Alkaliphilus pronyensis]|uniref:M1 family metallopeptidase n=2 Tax=Alkaliphilus pronyensis TaxID=1482732 RepID=A0A6I0F527_9FIRM|nr:M1 family metallopeptidase [Alkaliphilus pronyensis]